MSVLRKKSIFIYKNVANKNNGVTNAKYHNKRL